MLELTGQIADGCLLNYCVPPEYNDRAMELLEKGTAKAGRTLDDIDRPQLIVCSVDRDRDRAIRSAKELITQYIAQQPHIAKASGVRRETVEEIQSILGWPATKDQILRAMVLVPDELVLRITATGTPDEARSKVDEYIQRGCTCPVLYPLGDPYLMMDTFGDPPHKAVRKNK